MPNPFYEDFSTSGVNRTRLVVEALRVAPNGALAFATDKDGVIVSPSISSPVVTGKPTQYSTVTTYTGATDAIDISLGDIFVLARVGAADAATLASPAVGDNGRVIHILSGTAFAHTITITAGIGGAGGTVTTYTFTNRISASITLKAIAGAWYVVGGNLAAIA